MRCCSVAWPSQTASKKKMNTASHSTNNLYAHQWNHLMRELRASVSEPPALESRHSLFEIWCLRQALHHPLITVLGNLATIGQCFYGNDSATHDALNEHGSRETIKATSMQFIWRSLITHRATLSVENHVVSIQLAGLCRRNKLWPVQKPMRRASCDGSSLRKGLMRGTAMDVVAAVQWLVGVFTTTASRQLPRAGHRAIVSNWDLF